MVQIIENQNNTNVLGFAINGKVDSADVQKVENAIESKLKTNDKLRIYTEIRDHDGWSFTGLFKDMTQKIKYSGKIEKAAVIGEESWETPNDIADMFTSGDVQRFKLSETDKAKEWIKSPNFSNQIDNASTNTEANLNSPKANHQERVSTLSSGKQYADTNEYKSGLDTPSREGATFRNSGNNKTVVSNLDEELNAVRNQNSTLRTDKDSSPRTERDFTTSSNPEASYQNKNESVDRIENQFRANERTNTDLDSTFGTTDNSRRSTSSTEGYNSGTSVSR
jgi:hypothetical protein